jgi:hypothetical protein
VARLAGDDLNTFSFGFTSPAFDEMESEPFAGHVNFAAFAADGLRQRIDGRLALMGSPLRSRDVLRRATTQTCAGCHADASSTDVGGGITWPESLGFTHVDESGRLSPALTGEFLPHRARVLDEYLSAVCRQQLIPGDGRFTVGGAAVGAPN